MIDNLHWLFDRKLIEVHPSWKDTVKELKRYHRVKTPDVDVVLLQLRSFIQKFYSVIRWFHD